MTERYILASQSPRRKQLLEWAEIPFDIRVANTDESYPEGLEPAQVAEHIARDKAAAIAPLVPGQTVIAADTIVVLDGDIIGKPAGREEAIATLLRLSGRTHRVITAVALRRNDQQLLFHDVTEVEFHEVTGEMATFYVDKYRPYDKAGAYAIQEWIGVVGIKSIRGDFYNVMGLPVSRVVQALRTF
ncbi:MAG: septum formation protein Maf [Chitinophagaceae bacterium]|nr:MAG: septum formation protein Maf [Chitinophagaceae bacterium]